MAEGGKRCQIGWLFDNRSFVNQLDGYAAPALNEKDFKFRFKRLPNTDAIDSGYCGCCFVNFRRSLPNGVSQAGLQPMVCYGCLKMCHRYCYGWLTPTKTERQVVYFVCDVCRSDNRKQSLCQVCSVDEGILKEVGGFGFVHFICAITHPDLNVVDYESLRFEVSISYQTNKRRCQLCRSDNAYSNCSGEGCERAAHPYCVLTTFKSKEPENDDGDLEDIWKYYISAGENREFDVSHELPEKKWIEAETISVFKRLQQFGVDRPDKREILNGIYDQMVRNHKPVSTLKRGGFQYILCPTHSKHNMYCVCMIQTESEMVECQCCLEWYHYTCGSFKNEEKYICPFCFEWFRLKEKIFDEIRKNKPDSYELRVLRPPKYNIPDFILYMIVADRRLQHSYDTTGALGKLIKTIVYYYPLKTSKISLVIKELSERKIEQTAEQYLHEYFTKQEAMLQLRPVLGPGREGPEVIQANFDHNQAIHQYIIAAQSFVTGSNVPFRGLLEALNWKEEAGKLNSFATEGQILTLMNTSYPHPQLVFIREKLDQFKLKQQIAQAHNNSSTLEELQALRESAVKIGMIDWAEGLAKRMDSARGILSEVESALLRGVDYDQFKIIEERMKELAQLKVTLTSNHWDNYKKEVAFIGDLYSLCVKTSSRSASKQQVSLADKIAVLETIDLPKVSKDLKGVLQQLKNHNIFSNPKMHHVYLRFNRIVWDHEVATLTKDNITPEQLKVLYEEGVKLQLPSYDDNFLKVSVLYNQWESNHREYQHFFAEPGITKFLDDRLQLDLLYEKLEQATTFYTDVQLNTKKELAGINQKRLLADFAGRLLGKLAETGIKMANIKDMFRQADAIKFPKSSQLFKRLNDLLTSNNLIQQQYSNLQKKAQDKLDAFKAEEKWKKPRKEQIKSNSDKPTMREAKALVDQMKQSPVDYASEIETIDEYISVTNEIAEKTHQFMSGSVLGEFQSRQFWDGIKKDSQQLRKRILVEAPLCLGAQQVDLYHFEIKSRIIMSFKGFIPSDLDKLSKLLKFADQESIQLELGDWYGRLRTEVQQGTQLQKELDMLKNLEEQLNREYNRGASTPPFTSLANLRRSMNLHPLKVSSSPLIMGIAERAKKFETKAASLRSQSRPHYEQLKNVYLEGLRIPVELSALQWMAPMVERSCQLVKRWNTLSGNTVERLVGEYDKLQVKIDAIENDKNNYMADCKHLDQISGWIVQQNEGLTEFDISRAEKIEELWEGLGQTIRTSDKYESVRVKFLEYWVNIMKYPQPDLTVSYLKAKGLLNELYEILRKALTPSTAKDQLVRKLRDPIEGLERMLERVLDLVNRINKTKMIDESMLQPLEVIDITEIYYEGKALLQDRRNILVDIRIRRPYSDLHKFYQEFDRIQSVFADEVPRQPEERKREEPPRDAVKRQPIGLLSQESEQRKKLKREDSHLSSAASVLPPTPVLQQQPSRTDNKGVVEQDRKQIRDILARTIRKNGEFKEVSAEDHAKMIENQIFGDWIQNRKKYLEVSQNFQALFIRLQECPLLSSKVKRKNFEFLTLKGLVDNFHQITDSEDKLQSKARRIKEEEQQQQQTLQQLEQKGKEELEFKKEIDQIYELRRQREREQREKDRERRERDRDRGGYGRDYKDSRDRDRHEKRHNRDREREKRRERERSRSRSREKKGDKEELRFSEDESTPQQANTQTQQALGSMPSYLEKQYNIRGAYQQFDQTVQTQSKPEPVLFDPDEQENNAAKKEKEIPSGTVIKLKDCELDFLTRNKGKVVITGAMYTVEDVKRVKQFCDPNLDKIVIRKDKKESDILDYLAKPSKKKYRNLVGWFEATNLEDNENLKDLALECEDSKRIYGIQNELVKMHIMSSRQVSKDLINNRLVAPLKITSESVSKHLGERRMVFIMQFFTEKLYEMRFTMKGFPYTPLDMGFEVAGPPMPTPQPDYFIGLDHRYSTQPLVMTPTTISPSTPTGLSMMGAMSLPKLRLPPMPQEQDYRQKIDIEGWGMDVNVNIPDNPATLKQGNKNFSPITSEDEADEASGAKKPAPTPQPKSTFDIRNFLKSLNPEAINKLIEEDAPPPSIPPPPPASPFLSQPEMRPPPMPQAPPSFVYQPTGRMQHQLPPPLINPNNQVRNYSTQRPIGGMQHMGMHMPPPQHSMGLPPPSYNPMGSMGSMGLPPPLTGNRYSTMRPPMPNNPTQLPPSYYPPQGYNPQMMGHMQTPPPPGTYDMMRNQPPPRPFMIPKKDDQKQ